MSNRVIHSFISLLPVEGWYVLYTHTRAHTQNKTNLPESAAWWWWDPFLYYFSKHVEYAKGSYKESGHWSVIFVWSFSVYIPLWTNAFWSISYLNLMVLKLRERERERVEILGKDLYKFFLFNFMVVEEVLVKVFYFNGHEEHYKLRNY